jgi:hypothetical protein
MDRKEAAMADAQSRHDISDGTRELLRPHLKDRKGTWGGNARDNRKFINGVLWVLRTGTPCAKIVGVGEANSDSPEKTIEFCKRLARFAIPAELVGIGCAGQRT